MSLYHEAANVLDTVSKESLSVKSVVFAKKDWKSPPKSLFALASEAAKWSRILAEIIDKSGLLTVEKQLSATLSLVLVHDLLLSKKGVVLPSSHGLHAAVARHRARLTAELTKARIRHGFSSLEHLRQDVEKKGGNDGSFRHPRWVRVNTILTTVEEQLDSTFAGWTAVESLEPVLRCEDKVVHIDKHVPNLLAVSTTSDMIATKAYKNGQIILQDKASCFPAYLLDCQPEDGQMIDACAAPGNKTTHLAAIAHSIHGQRQSPYIMACEKDVRRSKTLESMVKTAGASDIVHIRQNQNFLKLDPQAKEFADVTALLLDPSCSGSGIVGRDDNITIHLPTSATKTPQQSQPRGKKRKHTASEVDQVDTTQQEEQAIVVDDPEKLQSRLNALSEFQLRLLLHAMEFPAANRVTYSTCSIHATENEDVVVSALASDVAQQRSWKVMLRGDQVDGMKRWHERGNLDAVRSVLDKHTSARITESAENIASACIRCDKETTDGTMGFFVAGFVRDPSHSENIKSDPATATPENDDDNDGNWSGFGDET